MRKITCTKNPLWFFMLSIFFASALYHSPASAEPKERETEFSVSPKKAWGDFEVIEEKEPPPSTLRTVLLWIPNRFLDFIDIFRLDVGAGFSTGAVLRVSKYAQIGYRTMDPASLRIGNFGRKAPYLLEHSSEFGIPFLYVPSNDRKVCYGEIGAGLDIFVVGAYAGVCVEELVDFVGGLFFLDVRDDDLH